MLPLALEVGRGWSAARAASWPNGFQERSQLEKRKYQNSPWWKFARRLCQRIRMETSKIGKARIIKRTPCGVMEPGPSAGQEAWEFAWGPPGRCRFHRRDIHRARALAAIDRHCAAFLRPRPLAKKVVAVRPVKDARPALYVFTSCMLRWNKKGKCFTKFSAEFVSPRM